MHSTCCRAGRSDARVKERFVDNGGVRIRYLEHRPAEPSGYPIVFVPGLVDTADEYVEAFECFGDRPVVIVELRGRGGSDAPLAGYTVADQAGDIDAVLRDAPVDRFHLMTFSRGTTPSLELAFRAPARVLSISIGDYPAVEVGLSPDAVERVMTMRWRGTSHAERVPRHVFEGLQADSRTRDLWEPLAALGKPVLVVGGPDGGFVDEEMADRYRKAIPDVEIVLLAGSGHDVFRPSRTAYPEAVLEFISRRLPGT